MTTDPAGESNVKVATNLAKTRPDPQERGGACPACGGRSGDGTPACAYAGCPKRGGASVEANSRLSQIKRRIREWRSYDAAAQGRITQLQKRVQNGVCIACHRSFVDLKRHMASKHPSGA